MILPGECAGKVHDRDRDAMIVEELSRHDPPIGFCAAQVDNLDGALVPEYGFNHVEQGANALCSQPRTDRPGVAVI